MTNENEKPENEAAAPDNETVSTAEPATETAQEAAPEVTESKKSAEKNFAALRKKAEEAEKRVRDLEDYVRRNTPPPTPVAEEPIIPGFSNDELTNGGQVVGAAKKIADDSITKFKNEIAEERLKLKFPDFDEVVNAESMDIFKRELPELARAIATIKDVHDQGAAVYKAMKKLNPTDSSHQIARDKAQAEKNMKKPMSSASPSKSPIGDAHRFEGNLTKELAAQLREEMRQAKKHF